MKIDNFLVLNEIENMINIENNWLKMLDNYCISNDYFNDASLMLLVNLIIEYNNKVFNLIEKHFYNS